VVNVDKLYNENLVCYDVQDNKKRKKLFDTLKDIGLTSIQESVFWGYLNKAEETAVQRAFKKILDPKGDRAFIARVKLSGQIDKCGFGYDQTQLQKDKSYEII
jgi:CRISPR-associated protein Cas2